MIDKENLELLLARMNVEQIDFASEYPNEDIREIMSELLKIVWDCFDLVSIADHIQEFEKKWAREVYKQAVKEAKPGEYYQIASSVHLYLNDTKWACQLVKTAEGKVKEVSDYLFLSDTVYSDLNDKHWGIQIFKKALRKAKTFEELNECYVHNKLVVKDETFKKKIIKKLPGKAKTVEQFIILSDIYYRDINMPEHSLKFVKKAIKKAVKSLHFSELIAIINFIIELNIKLSILKDELQDLIILADNQIRSDSDRCELINAISHLYPDKIEVLMTTIYHFDEDGFERECMLSSDNFKRNGQKKYSIEIKDRLWLNNLIKEKYSSICTSNTNKSILDILRLQIIHYREYIWNNENLQIL